MIGCGESQEGEIWEAAMAAPHYKLGHVVAIQDYNGLQIDGTNDCVMCLGDMAAKWMAFGWETIEIDGHDMDEIVDVLSRVGLHDDAPPTMIVAHTVKGKGVTFMENKVEWHGTAPSTDDLAKALAELA
jgi:transketolase